MNLNPQIFNFTIEAGQLSRIYFESTKIITSGINGINGFIVEGKSISGVSINSGALIGHYFSLTSSLTNWDNVLIRYEGGSDIIDSSSNPLFDFTLKYIENKIDEPGAGNSVVYAASTTQGNGSGSSEANAMSYSTAGSVSQGTTVMMLAGQTSSSMVISNNGTATNPIKFIGYNNAGKDVDRTKTIGMSFDNTIMPLFNNGSNYGIIMDNKDNIIIKNIQLSNFSNNYAILNENGENQVFDNIYMSDGLRGIGHNVSPNSKNNRVTNTYSANMTRSGVILAGTNNLIKDNLSCTSKNTGMDYYLLCQGGIGGHSQAIIDCEISRFSGDGHNGHGSVFKAGPDGRVIEHSLMQNVNIIRTNSELRHAGVTNCVMRNVTLNGHTGMVIRDGSSYNTIDSCRVDDSNYFIRFYETEEPVAIADPYPHHNRIMNCVSKGNDVLFNVQDNGLITGKPTIENNEFINNTFDDSPKIYDVTDAVTFSANNVFTNNIFTNIPNIGDSNFIPTFKYNNGWDYWLSNGTPISGVGNISIDPEFSPYPIATNEDLQVGLWINGNEYDSVGNQRSAPSTLGVVEIVGATSPVSVKLTWTNSITSGVTKTIIYRNDAKIGEVFTGYPSEFLDLTPLTGNIYKYEVQAVDQNGESIIENTNPGGNVVSLSIPN